jgi:hypothetical protein
VVDALSVELIHVDCIDTDYWYTPRPAAARAQIESLIARFLEDCRRRRFGDDHP